MSPLPLVEKHWLSVGDFIQTCPRLDFGPQSLKFNVGLRSCWKTCVNSALWFLFFFPSNFLLEDNCKALSCVWGIWLFSSLSWKVKVAQLCPTLFDPTDYTVYGILLATVLKWVAFPFRGSSQPRDWTQVACVAGRFFTSWATQDAQSKITCLRFIWHKMNECLKWMNEMNENVWKNQAWSVISLPK